MSNQRSFLDDDHSTEKSVAGWNTKRVAISALFVALAIALSYISIPIFPAAPFLKYDPSGIVCLIAALTFGPATGCVVATLPWIIRGFTNPAGALMSFVIGLVGVLSASLIYGKTDSKKRLVAALILSAALSIIVAIVMNLIVTPAFSGVPVDSVLKMIIPILLPFNIMKFAINSIIAGLCLEPLRKALD